MTVPLWLNTRVCKARVSAAAQPESAPYRRGRDRTPGDPRPDAERALEKRKMKTLGQFDATEYFASHNPRQFYRKGRRQMTPRERALFEKALELLRRGVPQDEVEDMVRKEAEACQDM